MTSEDKQFIIDKILPVSGPERPSFTMEKPATYPIFNSIVDNPTIGCEKYFVSVGEIAPKGKTQLGLKTSIRPKRQYLIQIYYHNNCSVEWSHFSRQNF